MSEEAYQKLAEVLDTLPNGFPATESGVEIKLLKKVFDPEEAELFCDLRLSFENAQQIAERTGRPLEGLDARLQAMGKKGQIFAIDFGGTWIYKMLPWIFGIYEFQLDRIDHEFCELTEEFAVDFAQQFFTRKPQFMQVLPVEKEIDAEHTALPHEQASSIVENSKSFMVMDCICKKERGIMDDPCDRPVQVCMAVAPVPGVFDKREGSGRVISKQEAYQVLEQTEKDALVHLTWNMKNGHFFICNCCKCCCGVLRSINEMGIPAGQVVKSSYYAAIDPDECSACGTCADERCQVDAIEEGEDAYQVVAEKCIGCGLCVSTCPSQAITLVRKDAAAIEEPPNDEADWYEQRGGNRGVDYGRFK